MIYFMGNHLIFRWMIWGYPYFRTPSSGFVTKKGVWRYSISRGYLAVIYWDMCLIKWRYDQNNGVVRWWYYSSFPANISSWGYHAVFDQVDGDVWLHSGDVCIICNIIGCMRLGYLTGICSWKTWKLKDIRISFLMSIFLMINMYVCMYVYIYIYKHTVWHVFDVYIYNYVYTHCTH